MGLNKERFLRLAGHDPENMDDLGHALVKVISNSIPVVGLVWNLTYRDCVSNTHSAPEGFQQNFSGLTDRPKGYPGFSGRVWVRYGKHPPSFGSNHFSQTLTHTGTGGYGGYDGPWQSLHTALWHRFKPHSPRLNIYSWDYKIFVDDFPLIKQEISERKLFGIIAGSQSGYGHKFHWEAESVVDADKYILENLQNLSESDIQDAYDA